MNLIVSDILFGFSIALDAVEGELIGATSYHSQRIAYICALMGGALGLSDYEKLSLCVAASLHDNGLTQYAQEELFSGIGVDDINIDRDLGKHASIGENNVMCLPIYDDIEGAILYHHERADGLGAFGLTTSETPLFARIIHLADSVDVRMDFSTIDEEKFARLKEHISKYTGILYDEEVVNAFNASITFDKLSNIAGNSVVELLYQEIPEISKDYSPADLLHIADMFATIIDFKSPFTTRHSTGIAEKAKIMGQYYGWDEDICNMLYFAGAVHDVGKLFVNNNILEKPGKLTSDEYRHIQDHATGTYVVLKTIRGIDDITSWASLHHEKLDGSGYPFKKTADELGKKERLMACLDIYQALIESRPYKDGMSHEKSISILNSMVEKGQLDADITRDIDIRFKDWIEPKTC